MLSKESVVRWASLRGVYFALAFATIQNCIMVKGPTFADVASSTSMLELNEDHLRTL